MLTESLAVDDALFGLRLSEVGWLVELEDGEGTLIDAARELHNAKRVLVYPVNRSNFDNRITSAVKRIAVMPEDDARTTQQTPYPVNSGVLGTPTVTSVNASRPPNVVDVQRPATSERCHVKVRASLAQEMRDAVWFLSEHGRPRVKLNEVMDEALEAWLRYMKKRYTDGKDFPQRGSLR